MTVMVVVGRGGVGKLGWLSWRCLGGGGREATVRVLQSGRPCERGDPPWICYVWGWRGSHDGGDGRGDRVAVGTLTEWPPWQWLKERVKRGGSSGPRIWWWAEGRGEGSTPLV